VTATAGRHRRVLAWQTSQGSEPSPAPLTAQLSANDRGSFVFSIAHLCARIPATLRGYLAIMSAGVIGTDGSLHANHTSSAARLQAGQVPWADTARHITGLKCTRA